MNQKIELSIVILCYRSGEAIIPFAQKVLKLAESLCAHFEIILVGNYIEGSDDQTKEIVSKLAAEDSRIVAIVKEKKGMMGWDLKTGLEVSKGEYICMIDGDGQFPIDSIQTTYQIITERKLDLVKTYRVTRHDGVYRRFISSCYNLIFTILFPGLASRDINSKPKIMSRHAYEKMELASDDWFIDAEIMIQVRRHKMEIAEVPIVFASQIDRHSFVQINAIFEFIKNLLVYRIKEFRNR